MAGLWAVIGILTLGGVAFILLPLARRNRTIAPRADFDLRVYKDQLVEVERDLDRGLLTAEQAEAARTEIKRRMLAATEQAGVGEQPRGAAGAGPVLMVALAIAMPAVAFTLYFILGSPGVPDQPLASRQTEIRAQAQAQAKQNMDMETMIARLAAKMEEQPDNVEGWQLLARSYRNLERYLDAAAAYNRALRLTNRDPDILAPYGEILTLMGEGMVSEVAQAVFEEVISRGGNDPRALFYLGVARAQEGDVQAAMDHWVKLANTSPADAPWLPELRQRIQAAADELGVDQPAIATLPPMQPRTQPPAAAPPAVAPGPSQADVEAAGQMSAEDQDAMIRSMVQRLAERLEENPGDRKGWVRLEQAYRVLGEVAKADEAKARIEALQ